jgi:hypothetical protein
MQMDMPSPPLVCKLDSVEDDGWLVAIMVGLDDGGFDDM